MINNIIVEKIIKDWKPGFGNEIDIKLRKLMQEYQILIDKQEDNVSKALKKKNMERLLLVADLIIKLDSQK